VSELNDEDVLASALLKNFKEQFPEEDLVLAKVYLALKRSRYH